MINPQPVDEDAAVVRMRAGNADALAEVFSKYRERLRRIVQFRVDYRLAGRISESDVLQETFIAAAKRLDHFSEHSELPAFLWLRLLANQELANLHRQHLGAAKRDARKEVSIDKGYDSAQTSMALAAQLVGQLTAASAIVERAEQIQKLESVLNEMEPMDREVVALRHFEELSNIDTAHVLKIEPAAASKRYIRAMAKLAELMAKFSPPDKTRTT